MTRIPQASENPYEPIPVTLAERRAAARKWFGHGRERLARLGRHVYVVECPDWGGIVKIGSAFDVELRLRQLQSCSPLRLRIAGWINRGGVVVERSLHKRFAAHRSHDEWFRIAPGDVARAAREIGVQFIEVAR